MALLTALELTACIVVGVTIAYHYVKRDWLSTQREIRNKRYEAMQERYDELCKSDDPDEQESATRLNAQLLKYYEEQEYEKRIEMR